MDAAQLLERGMQLYAAGRFDELARLVHPDAEIQMLFLDGEAAKGPGGLVEALNRAARSAHKPTMGGIEPIDDGAAVMHGSIRYEVPGHGFAFRQAAWLGVCRDGLLWRVTVHNGVAAARRAYEELGAPPAGSRAVEGAGPGKYDGGLDATDARRP